LRIQQPGSTGPCGQKQIELRNNDDFKKYCYKGGIQYGLDQMLKEHYAQVYEKIEN
jgi:hypothetical protein